MKTSTRYWLFQLPGWVFSALVLLGFHWWFELSVWVASTIMVLLLVKDVVLFPFLRDSYDVHVKTGVEQLIGQTATVQRSLTPEGFVLIKGELWYARLCDGTRVSSAGSIVQVQSNEGFTLIVSTIKTTL